MQKWVYTSETFQLPVSPALVITRLNELGAQGWEMCGSLCQSLEWLHLFLKRDAAIPVASYTLEEVYAEAPVVRTTTCWPEVRP